jgi:ribonuclease D
MSGHAPPDYTLIETQPALDEVCDRITAEIEIAMDTEADNQYHFRTRLCLIQLEVGKRIFLVDTELPLDLAPLWAALSGRHLVMHGSDFDLRLMRERGSFRPHSLFDTMLAAQLVGLPKFGLSSLLEQYFGLKLNKENQTANWSKRPLEKELLDYAATDALYLRPLRDILHARLSELGRLEWMRQKCQWQIDNAANGFEKDMRHAWRIGGSERMRGHDLGVLHAVWHWREREAERLDRPPFKIISTQQMLDIARSAPEGREGPIIDRILSTRGGRRFRGLREAVSQGMRLDPESLLRRESNREDRSLTREEQERLEQVKARRDTVARELGIDPTLIASRSQLSSLIRNPSKLDDQLLPWQADLMRPLL